MLNRVLKFNVLQYGPIVLINCSTSRKEKGKKKQQR